MNDFTTSDATRLNNKLAYDKIAVRPKRRPAKNARGAQVKLPAIIVTSHEYGKHDIYTLTSLSRVAISVIEAMAL